MHTNLVDDGGIDRNTLPPLRGPGRRGVGQRWIGWEATRRHHPHQGMHPPNPGIGNRQGWGPLGKGRLEASRECMTSSAAVIKLFQPCQCSNAGGIDWNAPPGPPKVPIRSGQGQGCQREPSMEPSLYQVRTQRLLKGIQAKVVEGVTVVAGP